MPNTAEGNNQDVNCYNITSGTKDPPECSQLKVA